LCKCRRSSARPEPVPSAEPEAGVTLLELLLALVLFSLVIVGVFGLWQKSQETYFRGAEAASVQQNARAALEYLVRDLRQARSITTAQANRIVFTSVLDANTRTYALSATEAPGYRFRLLYTKPGPPDPDCTTPCPLADYLVAGGLQLTYRDADGTVLPAPVSAANLPRIRRVDITLRAQMVLADPNPPVAVTSAVELRNR
jgi:type II secretory pathway pseudopilin PulG